MRDIIPVTKDMIPVANRLYDLGFKVMSASVFSQQVQGSLYDYRITAEVEFKQQYWESILGELPTRWRYYTETSSLDHFPISVLSYCEVYVWLGFESVEQRIEQIIGDLVSYLDTRDKAALQAIMILSDC
jgi:hypothetical protein